MSDQEQITLRISAPQIEQYCEELYRGSANVSRKHATLIALEGFITRHASTDTYSGPFHKIIEIIQQYSEQTRDQLLKEYADQLIPALTEQHPREIARIHEAISRNGFDLILDRVVEAFDLPLQLILKEWAEAWCKEAEYKALEASGYPEALNFKDAGIPLADYRAMCELKRKLSSL